MLVDSHRCIYTAYDLTVMCFTRIHCIFTMQMLFKGIAADVQDDDDDEIEWLKISKRENLTISIQINKSDEDPQVLVTRLKGSSQERIAQMICHKGDCKHEYWRSGVSLISDGQNITLTVMNVRYNQTGLYKISNLSSRHPHNKIYNVTLYRKYLYSHDPILGFTKVS